MNALVTTQLNHVFMSASVIKEKRFRDRAEVQRQLDFAHAPYKLYVVDGVKILALMGVQQCSPMHRMFAVQTNGT